MSIKVMSSVWELDLDSRLKLTLLAFADHADDAGVCWPSIDRIAWKSGTSERTIYRHVKKLEEIGVLKVLEQGGGRGHSTRYRVRPENGDTLSGFRGESKRLGEGSREGSENPDSVTRNPDSAAGKGDTSDAKPCHGDRGTVRKHQRNPQRSASSAERSLARGEKEEEKETAGESDTKLPRSADLAAGFDCDCQECRQKAKRKGWEACEEHYIPPHERHREVAS